MPPLPADFIHARACKLKCEKILTRPTGLHPALTAAHRPTEWVDKAANPSKCLAAFFLILERFFSKD